MSAPAKPKYRTTNWKKYNAALKARGSLLIWLEKDMRWHGSASGKRGRSQGYGDTAIQFCLTIKNLFNLALRQAMGLMQSLHELAGLDWQVTDNASGDAPMLPWLLDQIAKDETIASVSGDGAYDTKACHEAIAQRGAHAIIPTRRNAKPWKEQRLGVAARNAFLDATRRLGRRIWKKGTGCDRRSLVETKMRCLKLLGERVMARDFERQVTTRLGALTTVPTP
jgi:hypothetical protein